VAQGPQHRCALRAAKPPAGLGLQVLASPHPWHSPSDGEQASFVNTCAIRMRVSEKVCLVSLQWG
jgi:hypothetical protein